MSDPCGLSALLAGRDDLKLPAQILNSRCIVAARVDAQGRLLESNLGFARLLGEREAVAARTQVARLFVRPSLGELFALDAGGERRGRVYDGVMTVGERDTATRSVIGAVYRDGDELLLLAEYDIEGLENLAARVVELNETLAETQRDLVRANRTLQEQRRALDELSRTDALTGAANRREFDERLAQETERAGRGGQPLALVIADIDHFKRINDTYGHRAGDGVLSAFAQLLRASCRRYDLVARWGGEEFALLLPDTDMATACAIAERVRERTAQTDFDGIDGHVTASFGVAGYRAADDSAALYARADQAMYAAKRAGRNCVHAADV